MEFDEVFQLIGSFGRYQRLVYFLVCLFGILASFGTMSAVFLLGVPDHWCSPPHTNVTINTKTLNEYKNHTIPYVKDAGVNRFSRCRMYELLNKNEVNEDNTFSLINKTDKSSTHVRSNRNTTNCQHGFSYDRQLYRSTIVTKYDLVCDRQWYIATANSIYMAGMMIGVFVSGILSDTVGRRRTIIIGVVGTVASNFAVWLAPSLLTFIIFRFLVALFNISTFTVAFVLDTVFFPGIELVGPTWRVFVGIAVEYFWAFGYMMLAAIAFLLRDWRHLQLTIACSMVPFLLIAMVLPESPRWLYANGRQKQGETLLKKIARLNNTEQAVLNDLVISVQKTGRSYPWELMKTPKMAFRTLNIAFNWFVNSLVYYGLSLTSSNLGGNPYINFFISGAVEIPACIFAQLSLSYIGRRIPLSTSLLIGGFSLFLTMAVPTDLTWVLISLSMLGKLAISASFAIIYVYSAELFPTTVRSTGVAVGSTCARVGGIVAPLVGQLGSNSRFISPPTFGTFSVLAGLLTLLLPETKGHYLPETLEDGENFGLENKEGGSYYNFAMKKTVDSNESFTEKKTKY